MKKANSVSDLSPYAALFLDIVAWDEDLRNSLSKDYLWIEKLVKTRGISFIMIDMPEGGKVVDQAFQEGRLWAGLLPETFGKYLNHRREFLSGLMSKVFDDEGFLLKPTDTKAVDFLRQVLYLAKKVQRKCSDAAVLAEVEEFSKVDVGLRSASLDWLSDALVFPERRLHLRDGYKGSRDLVSDRDRFPVRLLSHIQSTADNLVSRFAKEFDQWTLKPKHGPGAVADGGMNVDKFTFPHWPAKCEGEFPFIYYGQSREDLCWPDVVTPSLHEPPVRLFAVPKTLKGPRMIASEPMAHMFLQLGIMRWIRKNLPKPLQRSIDFADQEPSRALCLEASKTDTNNLLATVDLSAASDRLSCWVVERIFRKQEGLLRALHACRTRWLYNDTKIGEPFFIKLKKYAPMGNGTTFPVQSIVYAIIAIACTLYEEEREVTNSSINSVARDIRVFGDDIILPSHAVTSLVTALDYLGLKVNRKKTFAIGPFRESCGMDAFNGVNVTPLYLQDLSLGNTADSIVSWVDVCKNAARKGLHTLAQYMESQIPGELRSLLPRSSENLGCLTLWSYFPGTSGGKRRYNKRLHRCEVLGIQAVSKDVRRKRESYSNILQYFVENPPPDSFWESGFTVRRRSLLRKRWVPLT